jgi:hypothetical protein
MKALLKKSPQFITDKKGKKLSVVLTISLYKKILAELEELDDIRLYDAVKAKNEKTIPFNQYLIQRSRKQKHA